MARVVRHLVWGALLVVVAVGCRTPQPELKPPPQAEVLTVPPNQARYNSSQFPDMAFRGMDDKYAKPLDGSGNGIRRASGVGAAPGMSPTGMAPGGMGGRGY